MEEKLLEEWQERLGLQDWAIVLRYNCKHSDFEEADVDGETSQQQVIKAAVIKILDEKEFGDRIVDFDFERTLVHELLHLKFGLIDKYNSSYESTVVDELRHQLLDDLARAMVMAKRGETTRVLNKDCKKVKDMYERS